MRAPNVVMCAPNVVVRVPNVDMRVPNVDMRVPGPFQSFWNGITYFFLNMSGLIIYI